MNPNDPAAKPANPNPVPAEQPGANATTPDEAPNAGKTGEGADSALALLKRRQEARRAVQPRPDTPEE